MDLDDSFTDRVLQRTKARKEFLNQKKSDFLSVGKKRGILTDEHQSYSDEPPKKSPKRLSSTLQSACPSNGKENVEIKEEETNSMFVPVHLASKSRGLAALKKKVSNGEDDDSSLKTTSEHQGTSTSVTPRKKNEEICNENVKKSTFEKYPVQNSDEYSDESMDENDFAENYNNMRSDHNGNIKMELGYSPFKHIKDQNITEPTKSEAVKILPSSVPQDTVKTDVDPAELPLSARKALFEKALLSGTPKLNENVEDFKLSIAQRAAMFENASKMNSDKKFSNFKEPKRIALSNLSKFDKNSHTHPVEIQPAVKGNPGFNNASPVKKVSPPVTSTPSPTKNVGSHTLLVQQKLIENSRNNWQEKEIATKTVLERKQEISSLVSHWEKLSSSSVENDSSETERNHLASEEHISGSSDVIQETYEHENRDDNIDDPEDRDKNEAEDDNDDSENNEVEDDNDDSENNDGNEAEDDEQNDCADEDSDIGENVFYPSETLEVSLKSLEDKISPSSSQKTGSIVSSLSCSGVSSHVDESSYNASDSQSCTSGSSVRSYNVTSTENQEVFENKKDKNPEVPLLYTVSFYRKQKQETRLTPVRTIVRNEKVSSPEPPDANYTQVIQERIKALQDEILRQQTVISQTSQALNLCSATVEFSGSTEQVEGERLLLIATQKRQSCLNEITRLKTFGAKGESIADGKGTMTISDLALPLKREFVASQLEGKGNDSVHYFLCLIRHGAQVIVTQMMSTDDRATDGVLSFTNHIQLQNLPPDFSVIFEVYALQAKKEVLPHEKKYHIKREHSKIRLTPKGKKGDGKILLPAVSSPGGPNAVRSPSFGVVGFTRFTLQNYNKTIFTLDKVPFASPLEGVLRVKLQLHAEHKVKEKGFLTLFDDVGGFGAWHRRWCVLDASHLAFWKYPDDEHKKEPAFIINLKQCITSQVKLVARDVCARPNTFQLVTVRPQAKGDKNTLISRSVNTLTSTKHLLSADTKEERILWCNKLNEALTNVRKWDPQALRPVEGMQN